MRPCPACNELLHKQERVLNGIPLVRCSNCDFVFADIDESHANEVNSSYSDATAVDYSTNKSSIDDEWFEYMVKKITKRMGPGRVLDVGCGDCHLLGKFKKYGWNCSGIDVSPWAETASGEKDINFVKGFIEDEYFQQQSFDLVVSSSTLEHIYHPAKHLDAMIKLVKPGGFLYIFGVPNYGSISIKANISEFSCNTPPGHVNYPSAKTVRNMFSFKKENIRVRTYGIPEIHRFYRMLASANNRKKEKNSIPVDNSENGSTPVSNNRNYQKAISYVVVMAYYLLGRPFNLGDKLEIIVKV